MTCVTSPGALRELLLGRKGGKEKLFSLGEGMDLPRCGIPLCFFAPNPALSGINHTSVLSICGVICQGQSQNKVSCGRSARDGAVPALKALPEKEAPRPNSQGPRRCLPREPVVPGLCGGPSDPSCRWTGHRVSLTRWHRRPCGCHSSECTRGRGEQSHRTRSSSVQELRVNLRSSNSQSQPVTFRKPFQVLLHSERLFLQCF